MTSGQVPGEPGFFGLMQRWENLLFIHWPVAIERIRPLVPPRLTIDSYEGLAYVTIIPFWLTGFRETYLPAIPGLSDFLEINCRTYVRLGEERGIWFFSLDASMTLAVLGARLFYSLPYHPADMSMETIDGWTHYRSQRTDSEDGSGYFRAAYRPGAPLPYDPGSLEFFLTERYVLYSSPGGNDLIRARVHHEVGELRTAEVRDLETDLLECAGVGPVEGAPLLHYWARKEVQADLPETL